MYYKVAPHQLTIPLNKLPDNSQNWIGNKMIASHCKKCWSYKDATQENIFWKKNIFPYKSTNWKEYFPNLQVTWLLHPFFVFHFRYMKFWLQIGFLSPLKWRGQMLPYLTFWTYKRHISHKIQVPLCPKSCFLSWRLQSRRRICSLWGDLKQKPPILP